jgi:radical SAM superfamily enzyme YgiQ (UPF0313 family)
VKPSCKVVVGGWHPSYLPDSMLQHPEIDYVVVGEGERAMVELAAHITKHDADHTIAGVPGVAYRQDGKMVKTAPSFISDLDQIPYPARHLLPMHLYDRTLEYLDAKPVDIMNVIRGCPFDCKFCEIKHVWGQKCRAFSPPRVVEEINYLVNKYGSKGIYFVGDNFTIQKRNTIEICDLMKKAKLDIQWVCDTRVDLVSRGLLRKMREVGCRTIWFGVESGSSRILEKINKNITLEQIIQAFKLCREEGIHVACSFMVGIPGETINDMNATFNFAKKLDPDWCQFNVFVAVPGSGLYEEVLQKGLYDRAEDFVTYVKTEEFNYELVLKISKRFHREFNRSPKRMLHRIRREGLLSILGRGIKLLSSNDRPV